MDMHFQLGSAAAITIAGLPARHAGVIRAAMAPWQPTAAPPAATRVDLVAELPAAITERLGDAGDGRRTSRAGDWLVVHLRAGWYAVRSTTDGVELRAARALAPRLLVREVVVPALMFDAGLRGGAAIHGSCVRLERAVPLIVGWAEAGKTEAAVALAARGASLTGDKWVVLDRHGGVAALPGPIHLRSWLASFLPEVRGAAPVGARARSRAAGIAHVVLRRLAGAPVGTVALASERMAELAEIGTRVQVPVRVLNDVWARTTAAAVDRPTHVVLLRTTDGPVECRAIATAPLVDAIIETSSFEQRGQRELAARGRYLGLDAGDVGQVDRSAVLAGLGDLPAIELRAPFPSDPRPIADEILRFVAA